MLHCILFNSPQDIEQFKAEIEKRQLKDLSLPELGEQKAGLEEPGKPEEAKGESWSS